MPPQTYAEWAATVEPIAAQLEAIAYRLRQGAIGPDVAADRLREIADRVADL